MTGHSGQLLIVDDEPQLLRALTPALVAEGYAVSVAGDGASGMTALTEGQFDALILDLGLPDLDGKDLIARIREWSEVPIIVLSARDLEAEKIAALDLGADDFINKPFHVGELLARIRAALRNRSRRIAASPAFRSGELTIDFAARRVFVAGADVHLTPREYALLRTLARHAGMVMTHRQIISAVWGPNAAVDAQFVRVLVGQLRQKIDGESLRPNYIFTETGIGYRFATENQ